MGLGLAEEWMWIESGCVREGMRQVIDDVVDVAASPSNARMGLYTYHHSSAHSSILDQIQQ